MADQPAARCVIGGDLGGTNFRVTLADEDGKLLLRTSCLTEASQGLDSVIDRMKDLIRYALKSAPAPVATIAIAAPGPLDPWQGIVYSPPNLPGWHAVPLKAIMEREFGISTYVGNDANLAALAEWRFGAARGSDSLIYMTVSTGVGGGIIDRGELILGCGGGAGEVGHMTIDVNGPRCNCGNYGCLESFASGTGIRRRAVERIRAGEASRLTELAGGDLDRITAELVVSAAREGDAVASAVMHLAGYSLGVGIANLMHLFDPSVIVLGGGVTNAGPLLFDPMREAIAARAMAEYQQRTRIVLAELGDDVGLFGAVALALSKGESMGQSIGQLPGEAADQSQGQKG